MWYGDQVVKETSLYLYNIACGSLLGVGVFHQWNVSFSKAAHNWEVDVFASFLNLLYSFRLRQGGEDK
jgi:hypothetical protein